MELPVVCSIACGKCHKLILIIQSLAIFIDTDKAVITGGLFPVGDTETVKGLVQQYNDNKNAKEKTKSPEGRSPVSTLLSSINHINS